MRFFCLLVLASITLLAAGAGWAEQREAMVLRGPMSPMTERPTAVNCTLGQVTTCKRCRCAVVQCDMQQSQTGRW